MNKLKLLLGILIGLIAVVVLLFLFSGKIKDVIDQNKSEYQVIDKKDNSEKILENITFNSFNEIKNIESDNSIHLEVFGENNRIVIFPKTEIKYAIIRGINNSLILCQGIHNPTIMELGQEVKIIYRNC